MAKMGKEDARRGGVYWLVEPCDGKRIHRLVQSTHLQGAQALANTHRLSLAAPVTPVAWSVATMHTAIASSELAIAVCMVATDHATGVTGAASESRCVLARACAPWR